MKKHIKRIINKAGPAIRRKRGNAGISNEPQPRITNETVAEHREEVLSRARKYIYPLQHSKHRIIIVSVSLLVAAIIGFFTYCTLALYRFNATSTFMYRVTQVIPFPLARVGGQFISYENYLFELRHYIHYYESQQDVDFNGETGRPQLEEFKRRALDKVINDAYVKRLADQNGISVSDEEINNEIETVRSQNRLGNSEQVLEDVLDDYWGWSLDDFRRSLKSSLLAQKVVAALDKDANKRANEALKELKQGEDFAKIAAKYSEDPATKQDGGEFGFLIDRTNRDFSAKTVQALYELKPGEFSGIINIGFALEIVKNLETSSGKVRGAHILINLENIDTYINEEKEKHPVRQYLSLPPVENSTAQP